MTLPPPMLPQDVSANGAEIWDWAIALGQWSARAQKMRELRADIARLPKKCGSCRHWMASRSCPRERSDGSGFSRGPHMNAPICAEFAIKASSAELIASKQAELDALAAATGTVKTPTAAQCEASQSGGRKPVTPKEPHP